MAEQISALPLFPLELVLYPRAPLPLHIFEERYKAMIRRCLEGDAPFGVLLAQDDRELAAVGCTARVREVMERYEDGRLDVMTEGGERFRRERVREHEAGYLVADVETIEEPRASVSSDVRERVITQHMKLLELTGHAVRPSFYEDRDALSYALARNAGLELREKQEVLELHSEDERVRYLNRHLTELLPRVEERESLRQRIRSNGHFEDFPPPDEIE